MPVDRGGASPAEERRWETIGPDHPLAAPLGRIAPPLVDPAPLLLNTHELPWETVEHLVVALARRVNGAVEARLYGRPGQAQHGIDVVSFFADRAPVVYQAKRWAKFTADDLSKAVACYADGSRPFGAERLVIVVTTDTNETRIVERLHDLRKKYYPLRVDLWDRHQLSTVLRDHPDLIIRFFGRSTAQSFRCSAAGPVSPLNPHIHQLPRDPTGFVGRDAELAELDELLSPEASPVPAVVIAAVHGMAGVGKTALAVRWAGRIASHFPDGQLYLDLRGHAPDAAMTTNESLAALLRSLGVPSAQIPLHEDEQAALYRSLMAERRVLVVLDNAVSPQQVRPLLPGSPGCLVVVTSRSQMSGLVVRDGAHQLTLDVLTASQAIELLGQLIGTDRVNAEPKATAELAAHCGYLPLALRIAGERVASCYHVTVAGVVDDLAEEKTRLDLLATADDDESTAIRTVFSWSYRALSPDAARAFRFLGLHPGPDISIPAAAALLGARMGETRRLLAVLISVHLVEHAGRDRYRLHDLLYLYAAERAAAEETHQDRILGVRRILAWYLHTATAAGRVLTPQIADLTLIRPPEGIQSLDFSDHDQALDWCETENLNLVVAVHQATRIGDHWTAWQIPVALAHFLFLRKPWTYWLGVLRLGNGAARKTRDWTGEAMTVLLLGIAQRDLGRPEEAVDHCRRAIAISRAIDNRWIEGISYVSLGLAQRDVGRPDETIDTCRRALDILREVRHRWGEGAALVALGLACRDTQRIEQATEYWRQALGVFREIGDRWGEGLSLLNLGIACRIHGAPEDAIGHCRQALNAFREISDRWGQGMALTALAVAHRDAERFEEAIDYSQRAVNVCRAIGDHHGEKRALDNLGTTSRKLHRFDEPLDYYQQALSVCRAAGDRRGELITLNKIDAVRYNAKA